MKKMALFTTFLILIAVAGCGPATYIEILEPDRAFFGGEVDFMLEPGDTLKVLYTKTCRNGRGTCWEVRDIGKNKTGYVSKKGWKKDIGYTRRMNDRVPKPNLL